jgi:hypothetical protein
VGINLSGYSRYLALRVTGISHGEGVDGVPHNVGT